MARFAPWLTTMDTSFQSARSAPSYGATSLKDQKPYQPATSAFLQAAQWTLAARHLPTPSDPNKARAQAALRKRLARVLESLSFRALLGLDNTLPALRALIILATWTGKLPTRSGSYADLGLGLSGASGTGTLKSMSDGSSSDTDGGIKTGRADSAAATTGEDEGEEEEWDVAKEAVAYDGEMFLSAALRIAAKMHLELDVQMALEHKQAQEQEQSGVSTSTNADANTNGMPSAKAAETLDRARVVSAFRSLSNALSYSRHCFAAQLLLDVHPFRSGCFVSAFLFPLAIAAVSPDEHPRLLFDLA